jgi:hypothetical protein
MGVRLGEKFPRSGSGRYSSRHPADWISAKVEGPYWILDTVEFKTAWHLIGV